MSRRVMPALVLLALALSACRSTPKERAMETRLPIEYLEVVSPEVESTCAALARLQTLLKAAVLAVLDELSMVGRQLLGKVCYLVSCSIVWVGVCM